MERPTPRVTTLTVPEGPAGKPRLEPVPMPPLALRAAFNAHETIAWRPPSAERFDGRPANDFLARADAVAPIVVYRSLQPVSVAPPSDWIVILVGAVIAAVLGGLLGAMLSF